jgi:hypothetical protein
MPNPRFLKVRNGAIFCLADVLLVIRKDINDYQIVLRDSPIAVRADVGDVEFLSKCLDLLVVPEEEVPATKLAVSED